MLTNCALISIDADAVFWGMAGLGAFVIVLVLLLIILGRR